MFALGDSCILFKRLLLLSLYESYEYFNVLLLRKNQGEKQY